ncbi:MAG: DUF262 domain-containing protein [Candidatus Omnitrophica bacterium]|nr:DUF262 domain-containing protein [Candidatus Omnitrophota bacterium]
MVDIAELKKLFDEYIASCDLEKSREIWERQSAKFRDFWKNKIMDGTGDLTEEVMSPIIMILDSQAKGIKGSGVEPVCKPMGITQNRWYRLIRDIKNDNLLKGLLDKLFNTISEKEQIKKINEIYESYHNPLTGKTGSILNDLLFAYNPLENLSVVSLNHRFMIIEAFELGNVTELQKLSFGEQVIQSRNLILSLKSKLGLSISNRIFSKAFYRANPKAEPIHAIWYSKKEDASPKERKRKDSKQGTAKNGGDAQLSLEIEEDDAPIEIDLKDKRVYSDKGDPSIYELARQNKRGNLKLDPEFQRFYIWDDITASRLIESIFLEVPIPIIYLAEEQGETYSVIDGQQRLKSLFRFLDNELELTGLQIFKELNSKKFQNLSAKLQNEFENYTIRVIKIEKQSHPAVKFEIFERLNRGSFKLNDQELRNCIYRGKYNSLLKDLAEDKDFMFLLGLTEPHNRMFDRELVLRFLSFYHNTYLNYVPPMKQFFNLDMEKYRDLTPEHEKELRVVFKKSVQLTKTVFGRNAFKRFMPGTEKDLNGLWEERRINQALCDVIMFGFTKYAQNQVVPLADAIREELIWLMTHDQEFIDSILISTSSREKVYTRFEKWIHSLKEVLGAPNREGRNFSISLKEQLFKANSTCAIPSCNQRILTVDDSEVDHIEFYWRGGKTVASNARLVHRYCNRARGGRE